VFPSLQKTNHLVLSDEKGALNHNMTPSDVLSEVCYKYHITSTYSRTLDCEQLGLRVFYKTSKNFEGILT
jgi:hypothetical protein